MGPLLDVAAGSGRLAHFLNATGTGGAGATVRACDDGSWAVRRPFPVLQQSHAEAVAAHKPAIVLCAWMPENTDFTAAWRGPGSSVREYILIGPPDSGLNGLPWETWGNGAMDLGLSGSELAGLNEQDPKTKTLRSFQEGYNAARRGEVPPFVVDGYERHRLDAISNVQIGRRDCSPDACGTSETISFRRKDK